MPKKSPTMTLTKTRLSSGVWEGILQVTDGRGDAPRIEALHRDVSVSGVAVVPDDAAAGRYRVSVPVPLDVLSDGVHTCLIRDADGGEALNSFTIMAGEPLEDDIRAEVELLRAELDMLKRAFRRHCVETM